MKVSLQKAVESVVSYLLAESQKVTRLQDRFLIQFALGAVARNPSAVSGGMVQKARSLGMVDDQDMVDTDMVRAGLDVAFQNASQVSFDWIPSLTFVKDDATELVRRMEA